MLILSRKKNESIVIRKGGEVIAEVTVVESQRAGSNRTRIGITADKDVVIHRKEIDALLHNYEYIAPVESRDEEIRAEPQEAAEPRATKPRRDSKEDLSFFVPREADN